MEKATSFAIVTTTINIPTLLTAYAQDARRFSRDLKGIIVVGDKKTPSDTEAFSGELQKRFQISCAYVSAAEQEKYLSKFTEFKDFLPWNCIQRRNVGMLIAYRSGADIVVTIDDDNFVAQPDYLAGHSHLGKYLEHTVIRSQTGWWNVCEMLETDNNMRFYHRGHPLSQRWLADECFSTTTQAHGRAVVNAGLWLDDPDVDAITRLCSPVRAIGVRDRFPRHIACDIGTWAPFNSQNTALLRELIPAYLLFPYVGRYDDIWASYVIRHIADHKGDYVTYGAPLVRQKRNPHNYFKDFDAERMGLEYNDIFLEALRACHIGEGSYVKAYRDIAAQFPNSIKEACRIKNLDSGVFDKVCDGFRLWSQLFAEET